MKALVVALAVLCGCATQGTELTGWTLETGGATSHARLPGKLAVTIGASFTLTAEVALGSEQRGKALAIVADCYHGRLAVTANGIELADDGDGDRGSWRFVVPPTATNRDTVTFVLSGTGEPLTSVGFGAAPRLVDDPRGDPRARSVAGVNRYGAIAALLVLAFLFVLYLAIYLMDRRRKEYAAMLLYGLTLTNAPLGLLGVFTALGPIGGQIGLVFAAANYATLLLVIHALFDLGPVHRFWWYAIGIFAAIIAGSLAAPSVVGVALMLNGPMTIAINGYNLWRLVQLSRGGPHAFDARIILFGSLLNAVILAQGVVWVVTGTSPFGGLHPMPLGVCLSMILQTIVLARQHVARQRAIAEANAELQRQVAERSRELGEAVSKLATRPMELIDQKVVDDRYVIIGRLGAGELGTVHEVERISDGKRFAMKLLRGRADPRRVARFAREARAVAEDQHPHLVPVLEVGIVDGSAFLVMPLIDSAPLLAQKARFGDRAWAMWMLSQIATGLGALHERGLLHRDLRAANVLVSAGQAKLADAGLAVLTAPTAGGTDDTVTAQPDPAGVSTRPEHLRGARPHLAPEVVRGEPMTKASDVFAFGVLARELLGAEPLPETIAQCLAEDPGRRPTAGELIRACTDAA